MKFTKFGIKGNTETIQMTAVSREYKTKIRQGGKVLPTQSDCGDALSHRVSDVYEYERKSTNSSKTFRLRLRKKKTKKKKKRKKNKNQNNKIRKRRKQRKNNKGSKQRKYNKRGKHRKRLLQLSQPKMSKTEWDTSVGLHVRWGTQDMLWPIKVSSLHKQPTERIIALAEPKKDFLKGDKITRPEFYNSCGRPSVIWNVQPTAKKAKPTERIISLATPKKIHQEHKENVPQYSYSCGRESPVWDVAKPAMSCNERPHTLQLARPKTPHPESIHEKPVQTSVPPAALNTVPSERLIRLSSPKQRPKGPFRSATWEVPAHVRNATASVRCVELAGPKGTVDGYKLPKDAGGSVSRAARRALITPRVEELAKPIIRTSVEHERFDPDAFTVKSSALYGSFSSKWIARLAEPVDR